MTVSTVFSLSTSRGASRLARAARSGACGILAGLLAACGGMQQDKLSDTKPVLPQIFQAPGATAPTWATQLKTGNFTCEAGNRVELRMDGRVTDGVTLVWKGKSYVMNPVSTSTGAVRLENKGEGLVWIQIPSKSMLLNARIGQQLANECRTG